MRTLSLYFSALFCLLAANAMQAGEGNALKDAKVGDWVEHKFNVNTGGRAFEMTMKQTITAKDDASVTIKSEMKMEGKALPPSEFKVDLTKDFNPTSPRGTGKYEIAEQGDEKLSVGGKDLKCHWMSINGTIEGQAGVPTKFEGKIWICPDVPLGGLVKLDGKSQVTEGGFHEMKKELTGSGRGQ